MRRALPFIAICALLSISGCEAGKPGNVLSGSGGQGGGGPGGTGDGNGGETSGDHEDDDGVGGLFGSGPGGTGSGGGGVNGTECSSGPDEDKDLDGFSVNQGDCNDCDANVNPGAIEVQVTEPDMSGVVPEPADEDCDGMTDNVIAACDDGLLFDDKDATNGARAVDLCQFATAADKKWGVLEAKYVRADGSNGTPPNPEQYALFDAFGSNVNVQHGKRMLAISSGHARLPGQPGACEVHTCTNNAPGNPPSGFPQDVPSCPGAKAINDDVGLELKLRSPKNATGYSFSFKFYSFEYPEWVCTAFNDQYISLVSPPPAGSISGNVSFDKQNNPVSVNVAFFDVCKDCSLGVSELAGTGFDSWDDAGATGWLQTQAPVVGGDEFTIRFAIWDTGDMAWDSTALIDNFQWVANGGTVVVGTEPIPDPK